jgi:hypothetical protein
MEITSELLNVLLNAYQAIVLSIIVWLLSVGYRMLLDIHKEVKRP